jgi:hypothetical protein
MSKSPIKSYICSFYSTYTYLIEHQYLTSFLNSSALSLDRIVIPRENIIDVARLAILAAPPIDVGRMRRVDDSMIMSFLIVMGLQGVFYYRRKTDAMICFFPTASGIITEDPKIYGTPPF